MALGQRWETGIYMSDQILRALRASGSNSWLEEQAYDHYSMPSNDYALLAALKRYCYSTLSYVHDLL